MEVSFYIADVTREKMYRYFNFNPNWDGMNYSLEALLDDYPCYGRFTNLDEKITAMTVCRVSFNINAHWEVFFHTVTGPFIKVELSIKYYRLLYGAVFWDYSNGSQQLFKLNSQCTFQHVFEILIAVAATKGPWNSYSDFRKYDCHDFVIEIMKCFGLSNSQLIPYEASNEALRRMDIRRMVYGVWRMDPLTNKKWT
ncbi:MAG: hypothetical protein KAH18_07125 [Psychromonas sp.]|nr:hypothetical protein [Psychromonas sp.]